MYATCDEHGGLHCKCPCVPPLALFKFPRSTLRQQWIVAANRNDVIKATRYKKRILLRPSTFHRVCSKHFPGGRADNQHSPPSLQLGYASTELDQLFNPSLTSTIPVSDMPVSAEAVESQSTSVAGVGI